jgi:hypothetical protein
VLHPQPRRSAGSRRPDFEGILRNARNLRPLVILSAAKDLN